MHQWRNQANTDSPFVKIVARSSENEQLTPILLNLPMRITSPYGDVLEVGSPIPLDHVVYLVKRIGERA